MDDTFSQNVLTWFKQHGRHDLPWQQEKTPYKVWVAEIMLQQTQVATVLPYYERFMARFPDVTELANAEEDTVLHYWTGLGYYARARNLHKTAKIIREKYAGIFPGSVEELMSLPGIGRSTAGGIIAFALDKRAVILDGNVKRVLCRYHCVQGWPEQSSVNQKLWEIAEAYTPELNCADYNQAMMDLGASICRRASPSCEHCPLQQSCAAFNSDRTLEFPEKKPHKSLPVKSTTMLILQSLDFCKVLLEKRPPHGIWGGLWSFPELEDGANPDVYLQKLGYQKQNGGESWPTIRHTFSHFHLEITPMLLPVINRTSVVMENNRWRWYDFAKPGELGLAAPVKTLLGRLEEISAN